LILVFGTICIDRIRRVEQLPVPGGYVEIKDERLLLGGEAANSSNALKIWGDDIRLIGNQIGDSLEASLLRDLLSGKDLLPILVQNRSKAPRDTDASPSVPVCDIYVTPNGERTMFGKGFSTAQPEISPESIEFSSGDWFTADPNMSDASRRVAELAAKAGMRIYLMDFYRPNEGILPGSFWQSSTDWAGFRNNVQRNVRWVSDWVEHHDCFTVLSDGPNGFVFGGPDHPVRTYPPFPAPEVVDTTGAGDVFRAGMLHGLHRQWPLSDCLRFASAAGCLKCRALGATTDIPSSNEILNFIRANPEVSAAYG